MNFHSNTVTHVVNVTLGVRDLKRSVRFYQNVLDLAVLSSTEDTYTLGVNEALLILKKVDRVVKNQEGLYHIAFLLNSDEALSSWYKRQIEMNTSIDGAIHMVTDHLDEQALLNLNTDDYNAVDANVMIGHVHLRTRSIDDVVKYYQSVGFNSMLDIHHAHFLSHKNYHHHLAVNKWGQMTPYVSKSTNVLSMTVHVGNTHPKQGNKEKDPIGITINYI